MIKTLTIIGGGSAYVPGLAAAILHHRRSLSLARVRLYDVHVENLEIVHAFVRRMAEGAELEVTAHTDLAESLRDTDAVLNTSRPGGLECRRIDETLPLQFGIPGQETVGPGGFFFALRSVPAALELVRAL
jgi:6-phospho-beta-glucosidase